MATYLRESISNGMAREQALIRRWWHESHGARGVMVWEYSLEGKYADGVWFCTASGTSIEEPGQQSASRFPLRGEEVVMCEAKADLTPEVIGQALVYARMAERAGAIVRETVVFTETGPEPMRAVAADLGLTVVVRPLDGE